MPAAAQEKQWEARQWDVSRWETGTLADALAISVLVIATIAAAMMFRDYGLGWDDFTHSQEAAMSLRLLGSGFRDTSALTFVNLQMYGGGFDMSAALLAKILPFDLFETRRLLGGIVGLVGLGVTWRIGRRVGGPVCGLTTLILLALCPLYAGHLFMNPKDGPFAVFMAVLLLGLVRAFETYPKAQPSTVAMIGLGLGLSIGARILGFMGGIYATAALLLVIGLDPYDRGLRQAAWRTMRFIGAMLPALLLGYIVMGLVWPWSVTAPLNPLRAVEYFSHFFEKPWHELFDGRLILVPDMPRSYVPTFFLLQMPEIFSALALFGTGLALLTLFGRQTPVRRRAVLTLIVLAAYFPILLTVAERPAMYNGIRHFIFAVPPLAVLGGLAGAFLWERLSSHRSFAVVGLALFALALSLPLIEMVRLHPYQYTYFNRLVGGVQGARNLYLLDFWGLSFKQAGEALRAKVAQSGEQPPAGRKWKVAVCGPHPPAEVALGPDFETTWDTKGADFLLKLGEFYCAKIDAPVLVTIAREGVVYAQAYDIRGTQVPSLLTMPPPS
jgi:MFS family permease